VNRALTLVEGALPSDFDDQHIWCGSKTSIAIQIDNAVLPPLAASIATSVDDSLLAKRRADRTAKRHSFWPERSHKPSHVVRGNGWWVVLPEAQGQPTLRRQPLYCLCISHLVRLGLLSLQKLCLTDGVPISVYDVL
jgi:hypothetical protein